MLYAMNESYREYDVFSRYLCHLEPFILPQFSDPMCSKLA